MKRIGFLPIAAPIVATPRAYAQQENDSMLFNHLSIGIDWGLLARTGVDVAAPITPMLDVRAGFNTAALTVAASMFGAEEALSTQQGLSIKDGVYTFTLDEPLQAYGMDISQVSMQPKLHTSNLELLVDFFPTKGRFHLTAGAFFSLGGSLLSTQVSVLNAAGQPGIPKSDWANTTVYGISTDKEGKVQLDIKYGMNVVKPYVGLGWGRPVDTDRFVGFNFDFGVYFIGGIHVNSYDYTSGSAKPVELNSAWINSNEDIQKKLGQYAQYVDTANRFPLLPMMRFSLFFRLF